MFSFLDKDKIYEEEIGALRDNRTRIEFDAGDQLRNLASYLVGKGGQFSEEALRKGAAAKKANKIEDSLLSQRRMAGQFGGKVKGADVSEEGLKIKDGESGAEYKARLEELATVGRGIGEAQINNPDYDFSNVSNLSELDTARAAAIREARKEASNSYGGKNYMAMMERERRLDRLEDKKEARRAENRRYELEIARLQQQDRYKAQDRRDRMILTLMQGLNNLGQAFTI